MKWRTTSEHFSAVSSHFQERPWVTAHEVQREIVDFIGAVQPGGWALDIGIGTGEFSRLLGLNTFKLIGVDVAFGMLLQARARLNLNTIVMADAHSLPLRNDCVDFVLCRNVLRHSYDGLALLREGRRVCRTGGKAFIAENCAANEEDRIFLNKMISITEPYQYPFRTAGEILDLSRAAGFSDIRSKCFPHLQTASMEYFRTHYDLEEEKATLVWQLFESASDAFRKSKQLHRREDGSYSLLSHWVIIEGRAQ